MLELKNIRKVYNTAGYINEALKGINLTFRDNEFVSVLGKSGCGKTTMLNIVGGLDKYSSGDLVIDGISTKEYKDHDWDKYRNNTIGFVFQSYNLIPHQSVLSNVELSLTLSGVSKEERRKRAIEALNRVGLDRQIYKKPNQLSGGQMQRVAIARAIVNNPRIILADEPTGALDTQTSIQVMEILKEIAKDRLVIMVTHNPELANKYSTRIINLLDGEIIDDSNPVKEEEIKEAYDKFNPLPKKRKKLGMSFFTAMSLSFKNLMTKKGRTVLTAFAGSIGIIGIALILSLSSGFKNYINNIEEKTLASYPLEVENTSTDMSGLVGLYTSMNQTQNENREEGYVYANSFLPQVTGSVKVSNNDLTSFKAYVEEHKDELDEYCTDIQYRYNVALNLFDDDTTEIQSLNSYRLTAAAKAYATSIGVSTTSLMTVPMMIDSLTNYDRLLQNDEFNNSTLEVLEGKIPTETNEIALVVDKYNGINDYMLYALGIEDYKSLFDSIKASEDGTTTEVKRYAYSDIINTTIKCIPSTSFYSDDGDGTFTKHAYSALAESAYYSYVSSIIDTEAIDLKVVGILTLADKDLDTGSTGTILYTTNLVDELINRVNNSPVVTAQKIDESKSVISGETINEEQLSNIYDELGVINKDKPSAIYFYSANFEGKEKIKDFIEKYNQSTTEDKQIKYSDTVGMLMSSISTIINAISYVLIAFVSISLVVSSIMIGIITNISVLERTKEIGVLRSIGASKKDIKRVFNAETFFLGLVSGILGIVVTILLDIPINILLKNLANIENVAKLPVVGGIALVVISVILTLIAGLIPASKAARQDPVVALRTE